MVDGCGETIRLGFLKNLWPDLLPFPESTSYNRSMLYWFILIAAVLNIAIGLMVLIQKRNPVNISFSVLCFLFAAWNVCMYLSYGYGIMIYKHINQGLICFIPPVALYMGAKMRTDQHPSLFKKVNIFILLIACVNACIVFMTIYFPKNINLYNTNPFRLYLVIYMATSLLFMLGVIFNGYRNEKFKFARRRLAFIFYGFSALTISGMIDMVTNYLYGQSISLGNMTSFAYVSIMIYGILKYRLFDIGPGAEELFLRMLLVLISALGALAIFKNITVPGLRYLAVSLFLLFFTFYFNNMRQLMHRIISPEGINSKVKSARRGLSRIWQEEISNQNKIIKSLEEIASNLKLKLAIFYYQKPFWLPRWQTSGNSFYQLEYGHVPNEIITRYQSVTTTSSILNLFKADCIIPLKLGSKNMGLIAIKRAVDDFSFFQEEEILLAETGNELSHLMLQVLIQENEAVHRRNEELAMIARQMAHEVKNPIAALWGAAQLLPEDNDTTRDAVAIIREEAGRVNRLLDEWKKYGDLIKLNPVASDIEALIQKIKNQAQIQFSGRDLTITINTDEALPPVMIDVDKIKQVLINLILNSVQAGSADEANRIDIRLSRGDGLIKIEIMDNGCGIKQPDLVQIKTPFFTTKSKGTGLGLAICEKIIKSHSGSLYFESDGQSFTRASLILPLGEG